MFAAATIKVFGVVGVTFDFDLLSFTSDVVNPESEKFTSGIEVAVEAVGLPLGLRFLRRKVNISEVASPFDIFDQPAKFVEPILPVTISEGGISITPDFGRGRLSIGALIAPTVGFDFQEFFREDSP